MKVGDDLQRYVPEDVDKQKPSVAPAKPAEVSKDETKEEEKAVDVKIVKRKRMVS